MVGDQAKKGNKSSISVSNSVNLVETASTDSLPVYRFSLWSTGQKKETYRVPWLPPPCERLEDIKGICEKLSGFCDGNLQLVLGAVNVSNVVWFPLALKCDNKNGRCSKDVLLNGCPIRAMYECAPKYNSCSSKNCKEFDRMTICPFADKEATSRCDYWFRLWKSSKKNKNPNKNLKDAVCGDEVYTKSTKKGTKLPNNVVSCCHSAPVPDGAKLALSCKPIYMDKLSIYVNGYGFGIRFFNELKNANTEQLKKESYEKQTRGQHLGVDLHGKRLIYCVADGLIVDAKTTDDSGWMIQIQHPVEMTGGQMEFYSHYMHMSYPPDAQKNYYEGQLIGLKPGDKTIIKAPFKGGFIYRAKCKESGVWGIEKVYDLVYATEGTPSLIGGGPNTPLVLPLDEPIELCSAGVGLYDNPFVNYKMQLYQGKKNDINIECTLYFIRMWVPYTHGVDSRNVKAGQAIGLESNTGIKKVESGVEHLHFELTKDRYKSTYFNPYRILTEDLPNPPRDPE